MAKLFVYVAKYEPLVHKIGCTSNVIQRDEALSSPSRFLDGTGGHIIRYWEREDGWDIERDVHLILAERCLLGERFAVSEATAIAAVELVIASTDDAEAASRRFDGHRDTPDYDGWLADELPEPPSTEEIVRRTRAGLRAKMEREGWQPGRPEKMTEARVAKLHELRAVRPRLRFQAIVDALNAPEFGDSIAATTIRNWERREREAERPAPDEFDDK